MSWKVLLISLVVFAILGLVTMYALGMSYGRGIQGFQNSAPATNTFTMYYADWCPHCRNAKPTIDNFEREYNNKEIANKTIKIVRVDCTDSELTAVSKQISDFNVTSFPTVKIKDSDSNTFEFDAKITKENLVGFVESVANN